MPPFAVAVTIVCSNLHYCSWPDGIPNTIRPFLWFPQPRKAKHPVSARRTYMAADRSLEPAATHALSAWIASRCGSHRAGAQIAPWVRNGRPPTVAARPGVGKWSAGSRERNGAAQTSRTGIEGWNEKPLFGCRIRSILQQREHRTIHIRRLMKPGQEIFSYRVEGGALSGRHRGFAR
jgi:hypothetical protein